MGLLAALDAKGIGNSFRHNHPDAPAQPATTGLALAQPAKGPLSSPGMPAMPGQSPLGMSINAPPGSSLAASRGQRSYLG